MPAPAPQVRTDIAVTFVSAEPAAEKRAGDVLGFAEAAMPVLIEFALQDIRGASLYSPALYKLGMSAFALLGWRTACLAPEQEEPHLPEQVHVRGRIGQGELIWQNDG